MFATQLQHVLGPSHMSTYLPACVAKLVSGMTHAAPSVRAASAQLLNCFAAMCGHLLVRRHLAQCSRMLAGTLSRAKRGQSVKASSLGYMAVSLARVKVCLQHCLQATGAATTAGRGVSAWADRKEAASAKRSSLAQPGGKGETPHGADPQQHLPHSFLTDRASDLAADKHAVARATAQLREQVLGASCVAPYHPAAS